MAIHEYSAPKTTLACRKGKSFSQRGTASPGVRHHFALALSERIGCGTTRNGTPNETPGAVTQSDTEGNRPASETGNAFAALKIGAWEASADSKPPALRILQRLDQIGLA
jgi:hypothetical protein